MNGRMGGSSLKVYTWFYKRDINNFIRRQPIINPLGGAASAAIGSLRVVQVRLQPLLDPMTDWYSTETSHQPIVNFRASEPFAELELFIISSPFGAAAAASGRSDSEGIPSC